MCLIFKSVFVFVFVSSFSICIAIQDLCDDVEMHKKSQVYWYIDTDIDSQSTGKADREVFAKLPR